MNKLINSIFFILAGAIVVTALMGFTKKPDRVVTKQAPVYKIYLADETKTFNQSIALEKEGKYAAALDTLLSLNNNLKDDYLFNLRLGWLYYKNMSFDSSIKYYKKAIQLSKNESIEAYLGLTLPCASVSKWEDVVASYKSVLKKDPVNYTANLRMGQMMLYAGEYKMAKTYFDKIANLYPSDYDLALLNGWNSFYLGDQKKAKELFNMVLMINMKDTSAVRGLSLIK